MKFDTAAANTHDDDDDDDDDADDDANYCAGVISEEQAATADVVDSLLSSISLSDFTSVATLGIGGFGRVELVCMSIAG